MAATAVEAWDEAVDNAPRPRRLARATPGGDGTGAGAVGERRAACARTLVVASAGTRRSSPSTASASRRSTVPSPASTSPRREAASRGLQLSLRQADADALPFGDESFDYVLSWMSSFAT